MRNGTTREAASIISLAQPLWRFLEREGHRVELKATAPSPCSTVPVVEEYRATLAAPAQSGGIRTPWSSITTQSDLRGAIAAWIASIRLSRRIRSKRNQLRSADSVLLFIFRATSTLGPLEIALATTTRNGVTVCISALSISTIVFWANGPMGSTSDVSRILPDQCSTRTKAAIDLGPVYPLVAVETGISLGLT